MILGAEPKNQVIWIIRCKVMAPNKSGLFAPTHGWVLISLTCLGTSRQKAAYIRRNLPMVERVFKILKLIVISPHDSIKCQSWEGFEKIAFYHYKNAHFYTVGQNRFF